MRTFSRFLEGMLHRGGLNSSPGEAAALESPMDREFAAVITAIAERRRVDRATAITVTPLFQLMLDRYSPSELKDYLLNRHPSRRGEGRSKYDLVEIGDRELKSFSTAFLRKDKLSMTFSYSDAWKTVDGFVAVLLNDQLWFW